MTGNVKVGYSSNQRVYCMTCSSLSLGDIFTALHETRNRLYIRLRVTIPALDVRLYYHSSLNALHNCEKHRISRQMLHHQATIIPLNYNEVLV